ncbi:MAG: hypothetical protein ACFBSC_13000 [Microcoleaceae cyanobacterium]
MQPLKIPTEIDTAYLVQPDDTLNKLAQNQFGDQQKWRQIRRGDGTHFRISTEISTETPNDPEFQAGETVYCTLKIGERPRPGYGMGEDFETLGIPDRPLTFLERQIYEFLVRAEGSVPVVDRQIVQPLLEHFLDGQGGVYQHGSDTPVSHLVKHSKPFKTEFSAIELQLHRQLQAQVLEGQLQLDSLNIVIPQIAFKPLDSLTLFAIIGGTQGADLLLKSFELSATGHYSAQLWVVLYDDFGLDQQDRYTPGLIAAWNLQHRGAAQPFIHEVVIAEEVSGDLILPSHAL